MQGVGTVCLLLLPLLLADRGSAPELGRPSVLPLALLSPLALDFCGVAGAREMGRQAGLSWGQHGSNRTASVPHTQAKPGTPKQALYSSPSKHAHPSRACP